MPIKYRGRKYDYFNGSLTITGRFNKPRRKVKVWDCFRFFGCSFVEALKSWDVGSPEQRDRILAMKNKRGSFEQEDPADVRNYCREECHLLAVMMRKLVTAHDEAGIHLKNFYGAGSTATALLKYHGVAEHKGPRHADLDLELGRAVAASFFGGRFEDSVVGMVEKHVYGFDISSAYPFALSFLPCLSCGEWRREQMTNKRLRELHERGALVVSKFRVRPLSNDERKATAWGPLPFRDDKGSISYGVNFTGWSWAPELLPALEGWGPGGQVLRRSGDQVADPKTREPDDLMAGLVELEGDAWVYETPCEHKPFGFMPSGYRQRILWGKEGRGLALKLGMNAGYGKTAQSIGEDPAFQSWIWAGMTTATTRGQILRAIMTARDPWNVLTIATDGIYSLEKLPIWTFYDGGENGASKYPPKRQPDRDTGTADLKKPLGGWEGKDIEEGAFIAKPGMYCRLKPSMKDVRARGVGRREFFSSWDKLLAGFLAWDRADPEYAVEIVSRRFYGAKHAIHARSRCPECKKSYPGTPDQGCPKCPPDEWGQRPIGVDFGAHYVKNEAGEVAYGTWSARTIKIAFDPYPKREREGVSRRGKFARLHLRDLGGRESALYDVGSPEPLTSPEGMAARRAKDFQLEQPDWDEDFGEGIHEP